MNNIISKKVQFNDNVTIYYYTYTHPFYKLIYLKNKILKFLHLNKSTQKNKI